MNGTSVAPMKDDEQHQKRSQSVLHAAAAASEPRNTWTNEEVANIYSQPLMELTFQAVSKDPTWP